ncbi:MAG: hypothetical protein JWM00_222 [Candidatus Saccharibacteria bacterium]|nr:hypothetical protein [Candidatus Saccharibacteria bacterium]
MDIQAAGVESVTLTDILSLATWQRERSSEELQDFINTRHDALANVDIE